MEGISAEFVNSLRGPLFSDVDGCMVCDDSIKECACIVLLDGNCLLVNLGGVEDKFVDHYSIRRTLSLSSPQLIFS